MKVKAGWLEKNFGDPHSIIITDDRERRVVIPINKVKSLIGEIKGVLLDYLDSDAFQEKL
jgi:hypothetical protein